MNEEESVENFRFDLSQPCAKFISVAKLSAEHPLSVTCKVHIFYEM